MLLFPGSSSSVSPALLLQAERALQVGDALPGLECLSQPHLKQDAQPLSLQLLCIKHSEQKKWLPV